MHAEKEKEIEQLRAELSQLKTGDLMGNAVDVNGVKVICGKIPGADVNTLRKIGDNMKDAFDAEVTVIASEADGKVTLICSANKNAVAKGVHCGMIIKAIAAHVGGSGGGRPDSAQAGGKDAAGMENALLAAVETVKEQVK